MRRVKSLELGRRWLLVALLLLPVLPVRAFEREAYNPAILSLGFSEQPASEGAGLSKASELRFRLRHFWTSP
jgi:hypothetical protein